MRPFSYALSAAALAFSLSACGATKGTVPAIGADDMQLGKADAAVQVIEYASASCSHCAEFDDVTFQPFKAKYIDSGQVHYALRELITPPETYAEAGFLLARCAGKDKYFPVLDAIFRAQETMFKTQDMRGPLLQVALASGMTEQQFTACVSDNKAIDALNKRVAANIKNTLDKDGHPQGTPIFYINGKQAFNGVPTLANLDKAIADAKTAK